MIAPSLFANMIGSVSRLTCMALLAGVSQWPAAGLAEEGRDDDRPPNVLFIISDDLSAETLSCYGARQCKTPHIDRLAARGIKFNRAYCQFPVCGPSRAALMSGMYPRAVGVVGNGSSGRFTEVLGERPSMSQHFIQQGYYSARVSKIYHMRIPGDITAGVSGPDHEASWTEFFNCQAPEWMSSGEKSHLSNERLKFDPNGHYNLGFGGAFYVVRGDTDGSEQPDVQAAAKAIEIMEQHRDEPFFLAVGFVRPHVPLVAPAAFYEPYPGNEMSLPERVENDWDDIPKLGISKSSRSIGVEGDDETQKEILAAYYASVAFMDDQVGKLLDAVERLELSDNTIVIFTADHGYHLGEHNFWQKQSLHEESVRIPIVMAGPGIEMGGTTNSLAQQIDFFPTLSEMCGLPVPRHCDGKSLKPVVEAANAKARTAEEEGANAQGAAVPDVEVHDAVFTMKANGNLVRTNRWAFISHKDGTYELYDMDQDPKQFTNLADDEAHAATVRELQERLNQHLHESTPPR